MSLILHCIAITDVLLDNADSLGLTRSQGDGGQPGTSQSAASQASPRQEEQQHRQRPRLVLSTTNIAICSSVALLKAFRTPVPGLQQLKESQATLPGWLFKDMEKRALSR